MLGMMIIIHKLKQDDPVNWRIDFTRKYKAALTQYRLENPANRSGTNTQLVFRVL